MYATVLALLLSMVSAAAATRAAGWRGVPVLMYHQVDSIVPRDRIGRDLTVAPRNFEAQLRYLRDHRIRALTAAELTRELARGQRPSAAVVLTFDDGYADAATAAFPLLVRYGARATFFVSSGLVGTPHHLTWRQMRAMQAAGMEIACHGTEHRDLSTLDRAGQRREAERCLVSFARYLGYRPASYAYPAGKYDATTLAVMRSLGIRAAFTERPGTVLDLNRRWELPRRRVRRSDDLAGFAALAVP